MKKNNRLRLVKSLLLFFTLMLLLSGLTAVPIDAELSFLLYFFAPGSLMHEWLHKVLAAYRDVNNNYPFLLYGYDWLAFAHLVLAILFIGPCRDPIKNIWVIQFGMIACVLILPLALIAGPLRGIPIGWQLIDCSFGVFGFIPLFICYRKTKQIISDNNLIN
jgi:hypothetical protein